jgi:DNA-binding NtrC family response regulator
MKKLPQRAENLRRALAQEAARIMSEHGIRDFLTAKRKAAERFGVVDGAVLPRNTEIEDALRQTQGNMRLTAQVLEVDRRKLYRLCEQFGIQRESYRGDTQREDE